MNCTNFSIGNYVIIPASVDPTTYKITYEHVGIITVINIDKCVVQSKDGVFIEFCDKLKPVKLTKEILETNNFKQAEDCPTDYISEDKRVRITNNPDMTNCNNVWIVHVDNQDMNSIGNLELTNLHELQNFLTLCGIKKQLLM